MTLTKVFRARTMLCTAEVAGLLWSVAMVLFTVLCCKLFESFLAAKPEGRKTVIGKESPFCRKIKTSGLLNILSKI